MTSGRTPVAPRSPFQTPRPRARGVWIIAAIFFVVTGALVLGWGLLNDREPARLVGPEASTPEPLSELTPPTPSDTVRSPDSQRPPVVPTPREVGLADASSESPLAPGEESPAVLQERARLAEITTQTHDMVASTLEQLHAAVLEKCWPDAPAGGPKLVVSYQLAFGRNGGETMRSVNTSGGDVPAEVLICLRDYPVPTFHIQAPLQRIHTDVEVSYP